MSCNTIGLGLVGFGTVGSGVWETLQRNGNLITSRAKGTIHPEIRKIAVRDISKPRNIQAPSELFTTDWNEVVNDPSVDIVVELIGGTSTAYDIVEAALKAKKPVVTGNKALLAERGKALFALSKEMDTPIHFEASIAGAIPIVKAIQDSYVGNKINSMVGIINGTSNYILERMFEAGLGYDEALQEAKDLGYAEADPTLDVNGWDAAHKAILLATLAYGFTIDPDKVYVRGIERVRKTDIDFATKLGYIIKLLCIVRSNEDGTVELRTQPSFIPKQNILSNVNGVFNAISLNADAAGDALFYGRGAGQGPTASAVVADIIETCYSLDKPSGNRGFLPYKDHGDIVDIDQTETPYYVRFQVKDRPGVIADIAQILADADIGISGTSSPVDPSNPDADLVQLVFMLHTCPFGKLRQTLAKIEALETVTQRPAVFRVESI